MKALTSIKQRKAIPVHDKKAKNIYYVGGNRCPARLMVKLGLRSPRISLFIYSRSSAFGLRSGCQKRKLLLYVLWKYERHDEQEKDEM